MTQPSMAATGHQWTCIQMLSRVMILMKCSLEKLLFWIPLYEDFMFSFLENIDYSECIEDGLKSFNCKLTANVTKKYNDRVLRSDFQKWFIICWNFNTWLLNQDGKSQVSKLHIEISIWMLCADSNLMVDWCGLYLGKV